MTSRFVEVGQLEDIPAQGSRVVETAAGRVALFRTSDDRVFALADRCPHKNGPLSQGIVHGHRVTCPLHNLIIDLATGRALEPEEGCATAFAVRLDEGKVLLDISELARAGAA